MSSCDPQLLANAIRFISIDAIVRATEGHQGVPLGMAEIATAPFTRHLKFNPAEPTWADRDRVVLSKFGGIFGTTGFGASGPADALYELFGITPAAVAAEAGRLLQSAR